MIDRWRRAPLALRFAIGTLAITLGLGTILFCLAWVHQAPYLDRLLGQQTRYLEAHVHECWGPGHHADTAVCKKELTKISEVLGAKFGLFVEGKPVLTTEIPPTKLSEADHAIVLKRGFLVRPGRFVAVRMHDADDAYAVLCPPTPPISGVLIGGAVLSVSVAAFLVAVWAILTLGRPLRRLAQVARELGAGNLNVRTQLHRNDEIGVVAGAFDHMADQLQDMLAARRQLLANVSHELRTPLSRIQVALDIAEEGDGETAREVVLGVREDLAELEDLVARILWAARHELSPDQSPAISNDDGMPIRLQSVSVASLFQEAEARFRRRHPYRHLEFHSVDAALRADPMLLRRALENLMENAHKYGTSDGPIRVSAETEAATVILTVADEGPGMTEAEVAHAFVPFHRGAHAHSESIAGMGLGLPLVQRIAHAHGGQVDLRSNPGVGTVVRLILPSASKHSETSPQYSRIVSLAS